MPKPLIIFTPILFAVIVVSSCKRPPDPVPAKFTGCRIYEITELWRDTAQTRFHFVYNDNGTVSRITKYPGKLLYQTTATDFRYRNKAILVYYSSYNNPTQHLADSIALDDQNRVTYLFTADYGQLNHNWTQYHYDANGSPDLITHHSYTKETTDTFLWQNGDLVNYSEDFAAGWGVNMYAYTYFDTLFNTGNITAIPADFELHGRAIYHYKHLRRYAIMLTPVDTTTYTYQLDSGGKITEIKRTEPGNYVYTTQITYACE